MASMPRPSDATKEFFRSNLPADDRIQVKPMFGQLAGFVNGHMFSGIYGETIFVRPSAEDRSALLAEAGAAVFEPMAGRPMKEYVVLPEAWHAAPERIGAWIQRALEATAALPPREKAAPTRGRVRKPAS